MHAGAGILIAVVDGLKGLARPSVLSSLVLVWRPGGAVRRQLSSNMATSLRLGIETQTQKHMFAKAFLQRCDDEKYLA